MKRDDELLRALLIEFESQEDWLILVTKALNVSSEERRKQYHINLLCDAGFMRQVSDSGYRLTNQGHDYLEAVRSESVWTRTKAAVAETGGSATLDIVKQLAVGFLKKSITEKTGIEL